MPEEPPQESEPSQRENWNLVLFTAVLVVISAAEYWAVFSFPGVALKDKVTAVLAIIGAYGIGLAFILQSVPKESIAENLVTELTSANAALCWAGNLMFLSFVIYLVNIARSRRRKTRQPALLGFISRVVLFVAAIGLLVYAFFHALVVVPISYPAILIAASVINAFETATGDVRVTLTNIDRSERYTFFLKAAVLQNKTAAKTFIMGLPAAITAIVGQVFAPFL
jgi:hypothetical protein